MFQDNNNYHLDLNTVSLLKSESRIDLVFNNQLELQM